MQEGLINTTGTVNTYILQTSSAVCFVALMATREERRDGRWFQSSSLDGAAGVFLLVLFAVFGLQCTHTHRAHTHTHTGCGDILIIINVSFKGSML